MTITDIAQAVTDVANTVDAGHLGTSAIVAGATAEIIQIVKQSGWRMFSFISGDTETLNRIVGGVIAFLAGLGLSWSYDKTTGTLIINGLLAASISHGFVQWVAQQVYYRLLIVKRG